MIRSILRGTALVTGLLFAAFPRVLSAQILVRPILLGGLPADSGLAGGFELLRYQTLWTYDARARFIGSIKKYEQVELSLESPPPATHDFFSEFRLRYRNYPEEDFWGLGPDSLEERRSNYRLEDIWLTATAGLHFRSGLRIAAVVGLVEANVGPGRDSSYPSTELAFAPADVPALEAAPDYWRGGLRVDYDGRDNREDPGAGELASFEWTRFHDRDSGDFGFQRYEFEYRRYYSISATRRLAGRARVVLTDTKPGQQIPFYMQPSIGGTDTVRGFDQYRFRSGNSLLFNIEYRQVWKGFIDAIAFADAGRVARSASDMGLTRLRGAGGVGARIRFGGRVFFGADLAFSREGKELWFRSGHTF